MHYSSLARLLAAAVLFLGVSIAAAQQAPPPPSALTVMEEPAPPAAPAEVVEPAAPAAPAELRRPEPPVLMGPGAEAPTPPAALEEPPPVEAMPGEEPPAASPESEAVVPDEAAVPAAPVIPPEEAAIPEAPVMPPDEAAPTNPVDPSTADGGLRAYAGALKLIEPTFAVRTLDPNVDNAHLHQLTCMKTAALPGATFGAMVSLQPHRVAHEIDPGSGGWSSNPATPFTGLVYPVMTASGPQFLAVRYA